MTPEEETRIASLIRQSLGTCFTDLMSGNFPTSNVNLEKSLMENQAILLGNGFEVFPPTGGVAPRFTQILKVEGKPQRAWTVTVSFGVDINSREGGTISDRASFLLGQVTWGAGGTKFSAEFDLHSGTVISVPSCYFQIGARFHSDLVKPDDDGNPPAPVTTEDLNSAVINAGMTWGTRPGPSFPTRTNGGFFDQAGGDTTITVPVPNFAFTTYLFTGANIADADVTVNFLSGTDETDAIIDTVPGTVYTEAKRSQGVRIPAGTRAVRLDNTTSDGTVYISFGLTL